MKTHFKKLQNPNYTGSWDLMDKDGNYIEKVVTIEKTMQQTVNNGSGGSEDLPVIHIKGMKPVVLNSTNIKAVARITGSNFIEDWVGKEITLYVQKVKAFGEMHDAIRIKKPIKKSKAVIDDDRFNKALVSIKAGEFDKNKFKELYTLTIQQEEALNGI